MSLHDDVLERIADDPDVRILHRLRVVDGPTGKGDAADTSVGAVVDVECTGLDTATDDVIELAIRRFRYDGHGIVTKVDRAYSWLQDVGRPLPRDVERVTGLTAEQLAGHAIDEAEATRLLSGVTCVIAHNAGYDRKMIERRLPDLTGPGWVCSLRDLAWADHGVEAGKLACMLAQVGLFHDGHRASNDADAVLALLQHELPDGRTALAGLLEGATRPGWVVRALGADFSVKDQLRGRGYRWDGGRRVWWREVADADRMTEEFWLARTVYSDEARPRALAPEWEEVTWHDRYR